ncbi:MAG: hypothetical protein H6622_11820 [Halobacteriovoraceae bacterium]|nr:hypothetical protein [Halobacteriovoraceae bacterium]
MKTKGTVLWGGVFILIYIFGYRSYYEYRFEKTLSLEDFIYNNLIPVFIVYIVSIFASIRAERKNKNK